ncbi:MAG: hypothetical protein WD316_00020 [Phycisphaeraceae bacterium]
MGLVGTEPLLEEMAARAAGDHCAEMNPRPLDAAACRRLYEAAA